MREAFETFDRVTLALVGIAPLEVRAPSGFMASFTQEERELLAGLGVVGFICERFYDEAGAVLRTPLDDRLIAISAEQLRRVERSVGITGGPRRIHAIRAALAGRWVNVLITDRFTADRLLQR